MGWGSGRGGSRSSVSDLGRVRQTTISCRGEEETMEEAASGCSIMKKAWLQRDRIVENEALSMVAIDGLCFGVRVGQYMCL